MSTETKFDYLQAGRGALTRKLQGAAADLMPDIWRLAKETDQFYVVGSGYDFDEFAAAIASQLPEQQLAAVACVWSSLRPHPFPGGERSFGIQQDMMEPHQGTTPIVLFCQSVIADRFEALMMLLRVLDEIEAKKIVLVSALISSKVEEELKDALGSYPQDPVMSITLEVSPHPVQKERDAVAASLDDRTEKYAPLMSEWLMTRRFGPKPKPKPESTASSAPTPRG